MYGHTSGSCSSMTDTALPRQRWTLALQISARTLLDAFLNRGRSQIYKATMYSIQLDRHGNLYSIFIYIYIHINMYIYTHIYVYNVFEKENIFSNYALHFSRKSTLCFWTSGLKIRPLINNKNEIAQGKRER